MTNPQTKDNKKSNKKNIKRNSNKQITTKSNSHKTKTHSGGNKKQKTPTKNKKQNTTQKGGSNDICKRNLNDLLVTNKKMFEFNKINEAGAQYGLGNGIVSDGKKVGPGPPPDPSQCIIL